MCLSQTVSSLSGTLLITASFYGIMRACKFNTRFLLFACIPLLFGLQQIAEGIVSYRVGAEDLFGAHRASLLYLFFAYFLWPFFIPLSLLFIEPQAAPQKMLKIAVGIGVAVGILMYAPILFEVVTLTTHIRQHSIEYLSYESRITCLLFAFAYCSCVIIPFFISSVNKMRGAGTLMLISLGIASYWYFYVFTSVWCFFAALLSFYIIYVMQQAPLPRVPSN